MAEQKQIELNGVSYRWTGSRWYETKSFITPSQSIIRSLNQLLNQQLGGDETTITNLNQLISMATLAREAHQLIQAENLARRIIQLFPKEHVGMALLCSVLRAAGKPQ